MKIRLSYVSNSSSSSFLIIYKKFEDFLKFIRFKGFDKFKEDLEKDSGSGLKYLEDFVNMIFWSKMEQNIDNVFKYIESTKFNDLFDIFELCGNDSGITWNDYNQAIQPITDLVKKYMKILPKISHIERKCMHDYLSINEAEKLRKWREKAWDEYNSKEFQKRIEQNQKEFAKKLYDALTEKGYQIKCLSYEDHTYEDAYMERSFMPFLSNNPEREYEIFIGNNH